MVREIGFTILNRLAALRLCEERGLVRECVGRGLASEGFLLYDRLTGGALGPRHATYRAFLESLFDELALDLGVLFDRRPPHSRVFPSERGLEYVLHLLNDPAIAHLWTEDETTTRPNARKCARRRKPRATPVSWPSVTSSSLRVTWLSS